MKIKLLVVAITVIILTVLSIMGFYVYKQIIKPEAKENVPATTGEAEPESPSNGGEEIIGETVLLKDDFEITLPPGWQEATTPPEGILAMAIDGKEDISEGVFQKLDFRTNFSVKRDDMKKYANFNNLGDYITSIKTSLVQMVPGISFVQEEQKVIDGRRAILIECSSRQEEADFKTLLVFVEDSDSIVYAISFNTFQSSWASYRDTFYRIAESFKLKYKIEL
ncbi:MAG: hypothetical protein ABIG29_02040 [Candidatus Nealsonbacteria bacterium]